MITFECASTDGRDLHLFGKYKTDKKIGIGVVNHCNTVVEPPEHVAGLIRQALEYIPPERLVITTDCGFGREGLSRRIAYYKCVAMVEGTNIVRRELGLPEARVRAADPKLYFATVGVKSTVIPRAKRSNPHDGDAPARNDSHRGTPMARLPYITSKDQVPAKDHAIFDSIVASRGAVQGPFTMFLHSPDIAGRVAHLGAYVRFEGSLDMRVRVLAAMVVAREFEAMYVWGAQTGGARRLGVPESTITAIRENHSRGIPAEDAQIVDFTRQLLRRHRIDDATASAMRKRFGDDEFIQLTGAIGYYAMLAMTVNACELEPAEGAEVLKV